MKRSGTITRSKQNHVVLGDFIRPQDQQTGLPARASPAVSNVIVPPLKKPLLEQDNPFFPLRLIILVPTRNLDTLKLAGLISYVVRQHKSNLLFLSVVEDSNEESYANEYMADLIELTSRLPVQVERKIVYSENWITVVKGIWQVGDVVICPTEQSIAVNGKCIPLGITLSQESEIPVLMFTGYYHELPLHPRTLVAEIKWWSIALMIGALSTCLQVWILQSIKGWSNPVLLCLSIVMEFSLIWIWNRIG